MGEFTHPWHSIPSIHTMPCHTIPDHTIPYHPILTLYGVPYQLFVLSLLHCGFNALLCTFHLHDTCLLHKITTQSVSSFHALICLEGISYLFCIVCGLVLLVWEHSKPGAVIRSRERGLVTTLTGSEKRIRLTAEDKRVSVLFGGLRTLSLGISWYIGLNLRNPKFKDQI